MTDIGQVKNLRTEIALAFLLSGSLLAMLCVTLGRLWGSLWVWLSLGVFLLFIGYALLTRK